MVAPSFTDSSKDVGWWWNLIVLTTVIIVVLFVGGMVFENAPDYGVNLMEEDSSSSVQSIVLLDHSSYDDAKRAARTTPNEDNQLYSPISHMEHA